MSSVSGLIALPGSGAYSASKYAVESLADALRIELSPWRIPVSLIEPGPTRTDMWGDVLHDYDRMAAGLSEQDRELYAATSRETGSYSGASRNSSAIPTRSSRPSITR